MTTKWTMNLGEDVVFQILLWLPVRLVLRFRCVCKEWCELIDGSVFKDTYLALRRAMAVDDYQVVGLKRTLVSSKDIPYEDMELILNNDDDDEDDEDSLKRSLLDDMGRGIYTISVTCWYGDYQSLALSLVPSSSSCNDFEISGNHGGLLRIINHVDGIVCFINGTNWFDIDLVNPALREIRKLPNPLFDLGGFKCRAQGIGFGYDDVSDDYKVVAIVTVYEEDGYDCNIPSKHIGIVYHLSTNSWKILGDMSAFVSPCFMCFPSDESVFSHGSIHWCMQWNIDEPIYGILAFDVSNELFREIPFPHGWRHYSPIDDDAMFPHLFTLDKSTIALVASTNEIWDIQEIEVWVMKEYGDSDSWTILYSISSPPRFRRPLSFWKKDKLLLETLGTELICYDLIRGELDEPEHCYPTCMSGVRFLHLVTGHESFVSVKQLV